LFEWFEDLFSTMRSLFHGHSPLADPDEAESSDTDSAFC
jgi:hypothetical protein